MEGTPAFESEQAGTSSPLHSTTSDRQSVPPHSAQQQYQQQSPSGFQSGAQSQSSSSKFSNGPHIRSRITVVCAECKRLKLKCDRRTPCGSCLKRDTVQRCVYSQAAAEKVDVQSLHNRLLVVESTLAQITSQPQSGVPAVTPFKSSYPSTMAVGGSSPAGQSPSTPFLSRINMGSVLAALPCNDRFCLVAGASGSSVVISLDDTASIWLNELEAIPDEDVIARPPSVSPYSTAKPGSSNGSMRVKLEPTPALLPPHPAAIANYSQGGVTFGHSFGFTPPVPFSVFLPSQVSASTTYGPPTATSQTYTSTFSSIPDPAPPTSQRSDVPQVTTTLLGYLPSSASLRSRYLKFFTEVVRLHPTVNVRHFERRIEAMISWSESSSEQQRSKTDLARELFLPSGAQPKRANPTTKERSSTPTPTLSFFSATCAALALGALISRDSNATSGADGETGPRNTPAGLFALSEQALSLFERTNSFDLDSVVALILQVLYLLHDGHMNVAQAVFPLMGKAVNVARLMGLAVDPDEFPGTYSLFEAETRRRIWWEVYFYDMLVSEFMGQQPLIGENSFTTKHVAELDDDRFNPSSTSIPAPTWEEDENRTSYVVLRNKLAQLVRGVRKQTFRELVNDDSEVSVDQATSFETEITTFINELPSAYRLSQDYDPAQPSSAPPTSDALLAQRCILAIIANRAVLKLYLPFLKEAIGPGPTKPSHQAVLGTINASHSIIYACRIMHSLWRDSRPSTFEFYDFGRTLFDAAVVCAHAVIQQPASILAAEAMKCVTNALDVMRVLNASKLHGESEEAIKIVELMKERAELTRSVGTSEAAVGMKRKRNDGEEARELSLTAGFQLPFVGPAVSSAKPEQQRPSLSGSSIARIASTGPKKDEVVVQKAGKEKEKEKEKGKVKYPAVGIRSRNGNSQGPPAVRQRTSSVAPSSALAGSGGVPQSPSVGISGLSSHASASSPENTSHTSTPATDPGVSTFTYPTQPSQQPSASQEPVQRDFSVNFGSGNNDNISMGGRSFTQSFASPPQPSPYSETPSAPSYPPAAPAFRAAPSSSDYIMYSHGAVQSPTYDQSRMAHTQTVPMQQYTMSPTVGPAMANSMAGSIPSTPHTQTYMLGPEKGPAQFEHHIGKSELERQMTHDYQPTATSHGLALTASSMATPTQFAQSWQQPEMPRSQWDYYKFSNQS